MLRIEDVPKCPNANSANPTPDEKVAQRLCTALEPGSYAEHNWTKCQLNDGQSQKREDSYCKPQISDVDENIGLQGSPQQGLRVKHRAPVPQL